MATHVRDPKSNAEVPTVEVPKLRSDLFRRAHDGSLIPVEPPPLDAVPSSRGGASNGNPSGRGHGGSIGGWPEPILEPAPVTQERAVPRILVIDDAEGIHDLVELHLRAEGVDLFHAYDAETGFDLARRTLPDLILLDFELPGATGIDVCRALKAELALAAVPIVFLTGMSDTASKVKAFEAGASDYVTKPFDVVELRARVRATLRTKHYHDMLATRAQLDGLTGLWNRAYFDQRLKAELTFAERHHRPLSLVILDIDHFKQLNDRHGHPFGDLVLCRIAETVRAALRQEEPACRYGGEEFTVILRETPLRAAEAVAERLREAIASLTFRKPHLHAGANEETEPVVVTASFGVATWGAGGALYTQEALVRAADDALYVAKERGRNRVWIA